MTNIINDLIRYTILFVFLKNICKFLNLKEKSIKLYENLFLLIPCLSIYSLGLIFISFSLLILIIKDTIYLIFFLKFIILSPL